MMQKPYTSSRGSSRFAFPIFWRSSARRELALTEGFDAWAAKIGDARLLARSRSAAAAIA